MTRDELIERVEIILNSYSIGYDIDYFKARKMRAEHILNTIFDALKEPTEEMIEQSSGYIISHPENKYCIKDDAKECWQAMLAASPLAPNKD
ncbi:MAG TPA: hypothetical protein VL020_02940 [Pseudomonadales bacterium]|nr:hypothetical protein [Pseudomonadales bacterium]